MTVCLRVLRSLAPIIYRVKLPDPCVNRRFSMASEPSIAALVAINPPDVRTGPGKPLKKDKKVASDAPKAPLEVSNDSQYG